MNLPFSIQEMFPPLLFFISFFGLITSRNIIKSVVFTLLMQTAVVVFWIMIAAYHGNRPPMLLGDDMSVYADPLPHALMLTAIVIGISVTAINITMLNSLFRKYSSTDWKKLAIETTEKETSEKEGI